MAAFRDPIRARQSKRLYIGGITMTTTPDELRSFLNTLMIQRGLATSDVVVSCEVNNEKAFAFAEFHESEDATRCVTLDGVSFQGTTLKIKRPKDYVQAGCISFSFFSFFSFLSFLFSLLSFFLISFIIFYLFNLFVLCVSISTFICRVCCCVRKCA